MNTKKVLRFVLILMIVYMIYQITLQETQPQQKRERIYCDSRKETFKPDVQYTNIETPKDEKCIIMETDKRVEDYVKTSLFRNKNILKEKEDVGTLESDLETCRLHFYEFRDDVWKSSEEKENNVVDKVNALYHAGNTEYLRNFDNMKIQDLFDSLVKS